MVRAVVRLLCTVVLALPSGPLQAADWSVEQLLHGFREVKSVKARFVERKYTALLTAPIEQSGTLEYEAPARLVRNVIKPAPEKMTLDNDRVTLETRQGRQDRRRTLSLSDYPALAALVECIRGTLAGDAAALNRYYKLELEGSESNWRLMLKPSDPAIQATVEQVRISGSAAWINSIEILQPGGDRSVMQVFREGQ